MLKVIRQEALEELTARSAEEAQLSLYRANAPIPLDPDWLLDSPLITVGETPALKVDGATRQARAKWDVENAIALHKWLPITSLRQARDNRLWTWLAHAVFHEYCRTRWPLPDENASATRSVRSHWILRGQGRGAVVDHALARLWWAAEATHAPWLKDPEYSGIQDADEYVYTRLLLGHQNIHLQLRDRSFGSNRKILLAALATIKTATGSTDKNAAWLGRELNIEGRYRSLDALPFAELCRLARTLLERRHGPDAASGTTPVEQKSA